ncbi:MAG: leucine-rich repeat domain-containing protein [Mycoplasma sp.]
MKYKKTIIGTSIILAIGAIVTPVVILTTMPKYNIVSVAPPVPEHVVNESRIIVRKKVSTVQTIEELMASFIPEIDKYVQFLNFPENTIFTIVGIDFKDNIYSIDLTFDKFMFNGHPYLNKYGFHFVIDIPFVNEHGLEVSNGVISGFDEQYLNSSDYQQWNGVLKIPMYDSQGNKITSIAPRAFCGNEKIVQIEFEKESNIELIGTEAFESCINLSGHLLIPNSVKVIQDEAFSKTNISSLEFDTQSQLWYIGERAFFDNSNLSGSLFLPEGIQEIKEFAFSQTNFNGLLHIPEGYKPNEHDIFDNHGFVQVSLWGKEMNWKSVWSHNYLPEYMKSITIYRGHP